MKPTLVILAAGMASRYGSMKQIQGFGPSGETIMDYSIYDAIRAGFGKVVFIIRKEFADDFKSIFGPKLQGRIETEYVFQELEYFTEGFEIPAERSKPWGTAHAVLCTTGIVKEPFAVINADDFYGRNSFEQAAYFLQHDCSEQLYAIIGYDLVKTLSDYGSVNRGVCTLDANGDLDGIVERINISKVEEKIICDDGLKPRELKVDTSVSMNFWCLHPSFLTYTRKLFTEFLQRYGKEIKSEFFIPTVADQFIKGGGKVEIIHTSSSWFGVTYKEDAPFVEKKLEQLIQQKEYPELLWSNEVKML